MIPPPKSAIIYIAKNYPSWKEKTINILREIYQVFYLHLKLIFPINLGKQWFSTGQSISYGEIGNTGISGREEGLLLQIIKIYLIVFFLNL